MPIHAIIPIGISLKPILEALKYGRNIIIRAYWTDKRIDPFIWAQPVNDVSIPDGLGGINWLFHWTRSGYVSKQLAEQYVLESKAKLEAGAIKKWRYKLNRLTVLMLIECYQDGHVTWKYHKDDHPTHLLQLAYILLHKDYLNCLEEEGKATSTIQTHETISRQFLEYLEQRGSRISLKSS